MINKTIDDVLKQLVSNVDSSWLAQQAPYDQAKKEILDIIERELPIIIYNKT